jgi:hypothetical protein
MASEKANLSHAVAEAEKAVAAIKDAELKRAAFEKVLEHLLGSGPVPGKEGMSRQRPAPSGKAKRGPRAYLEELIEDGFFKKPRGLSEVKAELANRGHHIPRTSLSGPLQNLCKQRRLRRQKGIASDKDAFGYTNW